MNRPLCTYQDNDRIVTLVENPVGFDVYEQEIGTTAGLRDKMFSYTGMMSREIMKKYFGKMIEAQKVLWDR